MSISYKNDYEYAQAKLCGSIVRLGKVPVEILNINIESGGVTYIPIGQGREGYCELEDLDLTPVKLGHVNLKTGVRYVMRIPERAWKQGIRNNNIMVEKGPNIRANSNYLINTIMNIYPNIKNCIEFIESGEKKEVAFSRQFKLGAKKLKGYSLFRKETLVGYVTDSIKGVNVNYLKDYSYVREELEEVLNENR